MKTSISVGEFIKTLTPITDFSTLKKGDKIFNRCSLSVDYVDTFDHIEDWSEDRKIVFYRNYKDELWHGKAEDYWFYYNELEDGGDMSLLQHLNLYFGYESKTMKEFISDFKEDFDGNDGEAVMSLLMFLNSYSENVS